MKDLVMTRIAFSYGGVICLQHCQAKGTSESRKLLCTLRLDEFAEATGFFSYTPTTKSI